MYDTEKYEIVTFKMLQTANDTKTIKIVAN